MIQIIYGSIFDSKCDLLIVPCDSKGGVAETVYRNLHSHGLLTRVGDIPHGKVHFIEQVYPYASAIGYAASVKIPDKASDSLAIESIAKEIVAYSQKNQISSVNIPLLGTRAGGLTPISSYTALQNVFKKESSMVFNIFCIDRESYRNLSSQITLPENNEIETPRVFVSYTGIDKENASWVRYLATELRKNGVDARLDIFHLKPGQDLPQWMTNEVILARKVLLICDSHYIEKADNRKGGVGWETMIIQGDMLTQGDNSQKYIAILREDKPDVELPVYMKSKYALRWRRGQNHDNECFKDLITHLFDCNVEPPLGPAPDYVRKNNG